MVGALVDTAGNAEPYLKGTDVGNGLTPRMLETLPKIKAIIADHPDAMYDEERNPDIPHYQINKTPVYIITGSFDYLEPENSGWLDF